MLSKFFKLISILLHPVFFLFCFIALPLFFFSAVEGFKELKNLEVGETQTITAQVTSWRVGNKSRPGTRNSRYPYGVRFEFIPKHQVKTKSNIVKSNGHYGISKELWDETRICLLYTSPSPRDRG